MSVFYFMVKNLGLQFLDVVCGNGSVLNDSMCFLNQTLKVFHFMFILLILHHCFLDKNMTLFCHLIVS